MMEGQPNGTETFSFTEEFISSLYKETTPFSAVEDTTESSAYVDWEDLLKMLKRKVRMELHRLSLIEYVQRRHIPRGLRIYKEPKMFTSDSSFIDRWNQILNKCSLDLMFLIIDTTKRGVDALTEEIAGTISKFESKEAADIFSTKMDDIKKQTTDGGRSPMSSGMVA